MFSSSTKTQLLLASPFFQNDEVFRADILGGRYTQPLGEKGLTQVDVRDIAEIAARSSSIPRTQPAASRSPDPRR